MADYTEPNPLPPPLPVFNLINWPQTFTPIVIGGGTLGPTGATGATGLNGVQGPQGPVGQNTVLYTETYGATTTFDIDTNGALQKVVLTGSPTLAVSVSTDRPFVILLEQDGVGNHTVTWFTTINWAGGTPPVLTTAGGKTDSFGFIRTSAGNYLGYVVGLNS